jgi:hypothetical protein
MPLKPISSITPDRRDPALQTGMFAVLGALLTHAQGAIARRGELPRAPGLASAGCRSSRCRVAAGNRLLQRGQVGTLGFESEAELAPILREAATCRTCCGGFAGRAWEPGSLPSTR